MDLQPDPAAPGAAAYPNTLPAASALFGTAEAARYSHFLEQLQAAAWQEDDAAAAGAAAAADAAAGDTGAQDPGAPAGGLPSLLQLTALLAGVQENGASGAGGVSGVEVTGSSAPLALVLSHSVDAGRRAITLRCAVHNRTMEAIKGVEVRGVGDKQDGEGASVPCCDAMPPMCLLYQRRRTSINQGAT